MRFLADLADGTRPAWLTAGARIKKQTIITERIFFMSLQSNKLSPAYLDNLYNKYNHRKYVSPDPLEFLYNYPKPEDREIVGLIASSFAYGNVTQILKTLKGVFEKMGENPKDFLRLARRKDLEETFKNFCHRWHRQKDIVGLLWGIKKTIEKYGSLQELFLFHFSKTKHFLEAAHHFVTVIKNEGETCKKNLLSSPKDMSTCKRLMMFFRWMVRKDKVDLGDWNKLKASSLFLPVDTHIHDISLKLKITKRKQADWKTVEEITSFFRKINPEDPTKYDFTLTRFGIRKDLSKEFLFERP